MSIAILGWGSLVWEENPIFDQTHDGPWRPGGPTLKLEFSRVSTKTRQGALTLVIDEEHGAPTTVAWCLSTRKHIEDAVCDLRDREGTTYANIGQVAVAKPAPKEPVERRIYGWAKTQKLDFVVWTKLGINTAFKDETGEEFVKKAVSYINGLSEEGKAKAQEYVWRAPPFVNTPVRRALQAEPWFERRKRGNGASRGATEPQQVRPIMRIACVVRENGKEGKVTHYGVLVPRSASLLANVRWVKKCEVDEDDAPHDAISLVPRAEAMKLIHEFNFAFTTRSGAEKDVEVETYELEGTTYLRTVKDSKDLGNIEELPVIIL